jgi:hypothetical protein
MNFFLDYKNLPPCEGKLLQVKDPRSAAGKEVLEAWGSFFLSEDELLTKKECIDWIKEQNSKLVKNKGACISALKKMGGNSRLKIRVEQFIRVLGSNGLNIRSLTVINGGAFTYMCGSQETRRRRTSKMAPTRYCLYYTNTSVSDFLWPRFVSFAKQKYPNNVFFMITAKSGS